MGFYEVIIEPHWNLKEITKMLSLAIRSNNRTTLESKEKPSFQTLKSLARNNRTTLESKVHSYKENVF